MTDTFLTAQSSRLSIALGQIRADARMGRSVNTTEIEAVENEYYLEVVRLQERVSQLEEEIEKLSVPIDTPLEKA